MIQRRPRRPVLLVAAALGCLWGVWCARAEEDLGRALFRGRASTAALARIGTGGAAVPAMRVACANCHGRDARGGGEGGVVAPAIDAEALSSATPGRPAYYGPASFARAVTEGVDPAGRRLGPAMPRYGLDGAELDALFAYLARVRGEQRTGVAPDSIRFVVVFPPGHRPVAEAVRVAFLRAWGGAQPHGRRLALDALELDPEAEDAAARLESAGAFAAVLAVPDPGRRMYERSAEAGVPLLFPFGQAEGTESPLDLRTAFASVRDELEHLLSAAGEGASIVCDAAGAARLRALRLDRGRACQAAENFSPASAVVLLGGPEAARVLARAELRGVVVYRLLSDALRHPSDDLRRAGARVMMSVPYDPKTSAPERLSRERLAAVAARASRDALSEAGRDLTRTGFMAALGRLRIDEPGWPTLDFAAHPLTGTRAVGIVAAH